MNNSWYCRCCIDYFKRENPTILLEGSIHSMMHTSVGMCKKCYDEVNPDADKDRQELNDLLEKHEANDNV